MTSYSNEEERYEDKQNHYRYCCSINGCGLCKYGSSDRLRCGSVRGHQLRNLPFVNTTSLKDSIAKVVTAQAAGRFLGGFLAGHAVLHADKGVLALCCCTLTAVDTASGTQICAVRISESDNFSSLPRRHPHITADIR